MAVPPLKPRRQRRSWYPFIQQTSREKKNTGCRLSFFLQLKRFKYASPIFLLLRLQILPGVGPLPPPPLEQIYFMGSISKLVASKDEKEDSFAVNQLGSHLAEETLDENHKAKKACVL